jgi:hypothetical protein
MGNAPSKIPTLQILKITENSISHSSNILPFIHTILQINNKPVVETSDGLEIMKLWEEGDLDFLIRDLRTSTNFHLVIPKKHEDIRLGISVKYLENVIDLFTIKILKIIDGSSAKKCGLLIHDYILGIEGVSLINENGLLKYIENKKKQGMNLLVFNEKMNFIRKVFFKVEQGLSLYGCEIGLGILYSMPSDNRKINVEFDQNVIDQKIKEFKENYPNEETSDDEKNVEVINTEKVENDLKNVSDENHKKESKSELSSQNEFYKKNNRLNETLKSASSKDNEGTQDKINENNAVSKDNEGPDKSASSKDNEGTQDKINENNAVSKANEGTDKSAVSKDNERVRDKINENNAVSKANEGPDKSDVSKDNGGPDKSASSKYNEGTQDEINENNAVSKDNEGPDKSASSKDNERVRDKINEGPEEKGNDKINEKSDKSASSKDNEGTQDKINEEPDKSAVSRGIGEIQGRINEETQDNERTQDKINEGPEKSTVSKGNEATNYLNEKLNSDSNKDNEEVQDRINEGPEEKGNNTTNEETKDRINEEKGNNTTNEEKGNNTTNEEKGNNTTNEEKGNNTTNEEKGNNTINEEKGNNTINEEKGNNTINEGPEKSTSSKVNEVTQDKVNEENDEIKNYNFKEDKTNNENVEKQIKGNNFDKEENLKVVNGSEQKEIKDDIEENQDSSLNNKLNYEVDSRTFNPQNDFFSKKDIEIHDEQKKEFEKNDKISDTNENDSDIQQDEIKDDKMNSSDDENKQEENPSMHLEESEKEVKTPNEKDPKIKDYTEITSVSNQNRESIEKTQNSSEKHGYGREKSSNEVKPSDEVDISKNESHSIGDEPENTKLEDIKSWSNNTENSTLVNDEPENTKLEDIKSWSNNTENSTLVNDEPENTKLEDIKSWSNNTENSTLVNDEPENKEYQEDNIDSINKSTEPPSFNKNEDFKIKSSSLNKVPSEINDASSTAGKYKYERSSLVGREDLNDNYEKKSSFNEDTIKKSSPRSVNIDTTNSHANQNLNMSGDVSFKDNGVSEVSDNRDNNSLDKESFDLLGKKSISSLKSNDSLSHSNLENNTLQNYDLSNHIDEQYIGFSTKNALSDINSEYRDLDINIEEKSNSSEINGTEQDNYSNAKSLFSTRINSPDASRESTKSFSQSEELPKNNINDAKINSLNKERSKREGSSSILNELFNASKTSQEDFFNIDKSTQRVDKNTTLPSYNSSQENKSTGEFIPDENISDRKSDIRAKDNQSTDSSLKKDVNFSENNKLSDIVSDKEAKSSVLEDYDKLYDTNKETSNKDVFNNSTKFDDKNSFVGTNIQNNDHITNNLNKTYESYVSDIIPGVDNDRLKNMKKGTSEEKILSRNEQTMSNDESILQLSISDKKSHSNIKIQNSDKSTEYQLDSKLSDIGNTKISRKNQSHPSKEESLIDDDHTELSFNTYISDKKTVIENEDNIRLSDVIPNEDKYNQNRDRVIEEDKESSWISDNIEDSIKSELNQNQESEQIENDVMKNSVIIDLSKVDKKSAEDISVTDNNDFFKDTSNEDLSDIRDEEGFYEALNSMKQVENISTPSDNTNSEIKNTDSSISTPSDKDQDNSKNKNKTQSVREIVYHHASIMPSDSELESVQSTDRILNEYKTAFERKSLIDQYNEGRNLSGSSEELISNNSSLKPGFVNEMINKITSGVSTIDTQEDIPGNESGVRGNESGVRGNESGVHGNESGVHGNKTDIEDLRELKSKVLDYNINHKEEKKEKDNDVEKVNLHISDNGDVLKMLQEEDEDDFNLTDMNIHKGK